MALPDFRKAVEVGAVAAMENAFPAGLDDVTAVIAVGVVDVARAPMMAGRVDYLHATDVQLVPDFHLVDGGETELPDERGAALRHHDALAGLQDLEAGLMEMIEVGVGDENEIDLRDIA